MSFPPVQTSSTGENNTTSTHIVTLPSGVVNGDRVLVMLGGASGGARSFTPPAGWTEVLDSNSASANLWVAYRDCDGSEGASISVTSSATCKSVYACFRITGYDATKAPEAVAATFGTTTTPDAASLTPTWGSADVLWFTFYVDQVNISETISSYPTSYTDNQTFKAGTTASEGEIGVASRNLTASSENPGSFTKSGGAQWGATTVAVKGSSGGYTSNPQFFMMF